MSDSYTPATTQGPRTAILAVGGVALVGLGLAAGMLLRSPSSAPIVESAAPVPVASAASAATEAASVASAAIPATAAVASAPAPVAAQAKPAAESRKAVRRQEAARQQTNTEPVGSTQPAQVCAHCGTVDSVRAVQQKGEGSGVGAVAGGVADARCRARARGPLVVAWPATKSKSSSALKRSMKSPSAWMTAAIAR